MIQHSRHSFRHYDDRYFLGLSPNFPPYCVQCVIFSFGVFLSVMALFTLIGFFTMSLQVDSF